MTIRLKETTLSGRFKEYARYALREGYVFDKENEKQVQTCLDILEKNNQGIWLSGNSGSGKTLFFEICQRIISPQSENSFLKFHMSDIVLKFNSQGPDVFHQYQKKNIMFDDVFTEYKGQFYSDRNVEVFELFIYLRYDQWRKNQVKTHLTTNNTKKEFINRYGSKCVFRMEEMCENILLGEKKDYINRRTYKNFISLPGVYHPPIKTKEQLEWEKSYNDHREYSKNNPQKIKPKSGIGTQLREALGALKDNTEEKK